MLILKFGGAAFKNADSYHRIAELIAQVGKAEPCVIVVSAPHHMTNTLFDLARVIHPDPPKREQDMLVSIGERVSMALLAMALIHRGLDAVSFTGSQSGIITSTHHSDARIVDVRPQRIKEALAQHRIPIIAGFQGVSTAKEVTTLGRGGSDTSAVALALAMGAQEVRFYKDVAGIFSNDPKQDPDATIHPFLSYERCLEIIGRTGGVLHPRAVRLAQKNGLLLKVLSFIEPTRGTEIGGTNLAPAPLYEEPLPCP